MRIRCGLTKNLYLCIVRSTMKALTLLVSRQRGNITKGLSYLTRCVLGWDLKHLVKIGHTWPQHKGHTPVPQPHPSPMVILHINHYDELGEIQRMNFPPPLGSISKRLDNMLSAPVNPHIIKYEPPSSCRNFLHMMDPMIHLTISCTTSSS